MHPAPSRVPEARESCRCTLGADLVVQYKFIDAVLPTLGATQRREIATLFRQGIEDAFALRDDMPMSVEYQAALLKRTNALLQALESGGATRH